MRALCGLSPVAMAALLYSPFEAPEQIRFHPTTSHEQYSDLFRVAREMMHPIDKQRIKATGKGNLPLATSSAALSCAPWIAGRSRWGCAG